MSRPINIFKFVSPQIFGARFFISDELIITMYEIWKEYTSRGERPPVRPLARKLGIPHTTLYTYYQNFEKGIVRIEIRNGKKVVVRGDLFADKTSGERD